MLSAEYFRRQSQICQRLSRLAQTTNQDISQRMEALAREHQVAAEELERRCDALMPVVALEQKQAVEPPAPKAGRKGRRKR
jgi:hypothetical protein